MFFKTPILETDKLILKKGNKKDFIKVYEYDFTKLRNINGEFEFVKYDSELASSMATYAEETEGVYDWIVYLKETMEPIANIVADREDKELNSMELSFNLHPIYWGNGYMKEAVTKVMEFLFENGYSNIICGYDEGNEKSKRVQEKIGFEFYKDEENSWQKNGVSITKHINIMNKELFYDIYQGNIKKK